MSNRIRVFISSTMRDLANERDAVERAVRGLNFEPVSAEGWLPNGSSAWERIEKEIASSDIFVLLIGERYGWSPESGPRAGEHLTTRWFAACAAGSFCREPRRRRPRAALPAPTPAVPSDVDGTPRLLR